MANRLDEMNTKTMDEGRSINVIPQQIEIEAGGGAKAVVGGLIILGIVLAVLGLVGTIINKGGISILPLVVGIILAIAIPVKLKNIEEYFNQLEQKIQAAASSVDNYQAQRVNILNNVADLLNKSIDFDRSVFTEIARMRSGTPKNEDLVRNEIGSALDEAGRQVNLAFENYPDLKAHQEFQDAMQQNSYLAMEVTAAREAYNDVISTWNRQVMDWPYKKYVAGKNHLTTRIPYIASKEIKDQSEGKFFE